MTDEARLARHRRLWEADHRHLWHPFTQMQDWLGEEPLIVDAGDGPYLVDTLGNRYLDGVSSLWCNVHGHRVPEIDDAVRAQLGRIAHSTLLGLASTASIECAEALAAVVPRGLTRVFFSDAGATAGKIAALVLEPVMQGADGMIAQPPGYVRRMREICDRHGALLVCDEVATGFGRTGTLFAVEQEGVVPDILTVAKGITGGYLPLAATVTTEAIFESFLGDHESRRTFFHGHTYAGNPLACAAATASMRLSRERRIVEGLPAKAQALRRALEPALAHAHVGEVRQRGLMVGLELVADRATRAAYGYAVRAGHQVILAARRRGAVLRPLGNVVVLMPPLSLTEAELAELAGIALASIDEVTARL